MTRHNPEDYFPAYEPPLTDGQMESRETWMMTEGNWRGDHYAPSVGDHYRYQWKWDDLKGAAINAFRGDPDRASLVLHSLEGHRDPMTGFLPNKIFATQRHKTWRDYPEAWNFNNNRIGTSYTQPSLNAWAAMETYQSYAHQGREDEGLQFLASIYGSAEVGDYSGLQGEHAYFLLHRRNSPDDPLIGIVHPNETGRDSDEANKPWLVRAQAEGRHISPRQEWLHMQKLGYRLGRLGRDPKHQRIDWIPDKTRKEYWVNDVMFNVMHAHGMSTLAEIGSILARSTANTRLQDYYYENTNRFDGLAAEAEQAILERMWDPSTKFFYNLDRHGERIPVPSITGLFPLMLEGIAKRQTTALVDKLQDPKWFATPYPVPTHAVCSDFHDPEPSGFKNAFTPQWSGPVWLDMNHLIVEEGLVPRLLDAIETNHANYDPALAGRALDVGLHIADKSRELLASSTAVWEYYGAESGQGNRVKHFMWSVIGRHHPKVRWLANHLELPTPENLDESAA